MSKEAQAQGKGVAEMVAAKRRGLTDEQKAMRKTGICASDVACICGLNPYRSAIQVWAEKRGTLPEEDLSKNEAVYWGLALEEPIRRRYQERHTVIAGIESVGTLRRSTEKWMLATPDGMAVKQVEEDEDALAWGVELKTAGFQAGKRFGKDGDSDQVPEEYLIQCAWGMAVCGIERWDLAVLIAGSDYREFELHRDMELEKRLIEIGRKFWFEKVLAGVQPEIDASKSAAKTLARLYPRDEQPLIQAGEEIEDWMLKLKTARQRVAAAEGEKKEAENKLKAIIGDAAGCEGAMGKITWKANKDRVVVNWQGVAAILKKLLPANKFAQLVAKQTTTKPGARVFRPTWAE